VCLCVNLVCLCGNCAACFKTVSLLNQIFIFLLYMSFYIKCCVTSYCLILLLNQTTELKTLPISLSHNFAQSPFHVSIGQSQLRLEFQHRSFNMTFVTVNVLYMYVCICVCVCVCMCQFCNVRVCENVWFFQVCVLVKLYL
jgi:hypothetical protein